MSGVEVGGRAAGEAGAMAIILAPPPSPSVYPLELSTAFCSTTVIAKYLCAVYRYQLLHSMIMLNELHSCSSSYFVCVCLCNTEPQQEVVSFWVATLIKNPNECS